MVKVIQFKTPGGPDVLEMTDIELAAPAEGEITIRHTAIGLNFIDTYHRSGLYPLPLPSGIGMEGAGVIEAIGSGVTGLAVGDRIAYASPPPGSYAESRNIAADRVVKIPSGIEDQTAAAMMLKGMTAQYLIRQIYKVGKGDTILIHAAAGGVGQIVCQWANHLGATVIGTVGSEAKAEIAKTNGCHYPVLYNDEDFVERVTEITDGKMLPVVYDSIGDSTFQKSLNCLRQRGLLVSFGQASGPIPPVDLGIFAQKGSLFFTRPTLFNYIATAEDLRSTADDLFHAVSSGIVKIHIDQTFPLADVRAAHEALEARKPQDLLF